jgi:hypothetical protein
MASARRGRGGVTRRQSAPAVRIAALAARAAGRTEAQPTRAAGHRDAAADDL